MTRGLCEVADHEVAPVIVPGRVIRAESADQVLVRVVVAAIPQGGEAACPPDVRQEGPDARGKSDLFDGSGERLGPLRIAAHRHQLGLERHRSRRQAQLTGLFGQTAALFRVARREVPSFSA